MSKLISLAISIALLGAQATGYAFLSNQSATDEHKLIAQASPHANEVAVQVVADMNTREEGPVAAPVDSETTTNVSVSHIEDSLPNPAPLLETTDSLADRAPVIEPQSSPESSSQTEVSTVTEESGSMESTSPEENQTQTQSISSESSEKNGVVSDEKKDRSGDYKRSEPFESQLKVVEVRDAKGKLVSTQTTQIGSTTMLERFYDAKGQISQLNIYKDGKLLTQSFYQYDEKGEFSKSATYDPKGNLIKGRIYIHHPNGTMEIVDSYSEDLPKPPGQNGPGQTPPGQNNIG